MIIDFYTLFFKRRVYKSFMHNAQLIFMQLISEEGYNNFKFPMIIDFHISSLIKVVYKSSIYNA